MAATAHRSASWLALASKCCDILSTKRVDRLVDEAELRRMLLAMRGAETAGARLMANEVAYETAFDMFDEEALNEDGLEDFYWFLEAVMKVERDMKVKWNESVQRWRDIVAWLHDKGLSALLVRSQPERAARWITNNLLDQQTSVSMRDAEVLWSKSTADIVLEAVASAERLYQTAVLADDVSTHRHADNFLHLWRTCTAASSSDAALPSTDQALSLLSDPSASLGERGTPARQSAGAAQQKRPRFLRVDRELGAVMAACGVLDVCIDMLLVRSRVATIAAGSTNIAAGADADATADDAGDDAGEGPTRAQYALRTAALDCALTLLVMRFYASQDPTEAVARRNSVEFIEERFGPFVRAAIAIGDENARALGADTLAVWAHRFPEVARWCLCRRNVLLPVCARLDTSKRTCEARTPVRARLLALLAAASAGSGDHGRRTLVASDGLQAVTSLLLRRPPDDFRAPLKVRWSSEPLGLEYHRAADTFADEQLDMILLERPTEQPESPFDDDRFCGPKDAELLQRLLRLFLSEWGPVEFGASCCDTPQMLHALVQSPFTPIDCLRAVFTSHKIQVALRRFSSEVGADSAKEAFGALHMDTTAQPAAVISGLARAPSAVQHATEAFARNAAFALCASAVHNLYAGFYDGGGASATYVPLAGDAPPPNASAASASATMRNPLPSVRAQPMAVGAGSATAATPSLSASLVSAGSAARRAPARGDESEAMLETKQAIAQALMLGDSMADLVASMWTMLRAKRRMHRDRLAIAGSAFRWCLVLIDLVGESVPLSNFERSLLSVGKRLYFRVTRYATLGDSSDGALSEGAESAAQSLESVPPVEITTSRSELYILRREHSDYALLSQLFRQYSLAALLDSMARVLRKLAQLTSSLAAGEVASDAVARTCEVCRSLAAFFVFDLCFSNRDSVPAAVCDPAAAIGLTLEHVEALHEIATQEPEQIVLRRRTQAGVELADLREFTFVNIAGQWLLWANNDEAPYCRSTGAQAYFAPA